MIPLVRSIRAHLCLLSLIMLAGGSTAETLPSPPSALTRASDMAEIQNIFAQYVATLDADTIGESRAARAAKFTALFTFDGIWTEHLWHAGTPIDDGPGCLVQGSSQLLRFAQVLFDSAGSEPSASTRHNLVTPLIEIRGDRASAAVNWIQTRDDTLAHGRVDLLATGRYYLSLRREAWGWAIEKLDLMSDHPLYGTALEPPCTPVGPR